jgi:hypothetical protein
MFSYIRSVLGRDTIIEGELTRDGDQLTATIRAQGTSAASFHGEIADNLQSQRCSGAIWETYLGLAKP